MNRHPYSGRIPQPSRPLGLPGSLKPSPDPLPGGNLPPGRLANRHRNPVKSPLPGGNLPPSPNPDPPRPATDGPGLSGSSWPPAWAS